MKKYWEKRREQRPEPKLELVKKGKKGSAVMFDEAYIISDEAFELLPPKKRYKCPDCKRRFSKLHKCQDGKKRCGNCKKKLITNKFYIPLKERKRLDQISKFNLSHLEKRQLHRQFMNEGLDSAQAWKKVNRHCYYLKQMKQRKRGLEAIKKKREQKKKQEAVKQKTKFLKGLK